eukprot:CAMPEP_0202005438 /NCGR_PEP_ID=MMETSP0905-20130828/10474_1 /ASSEMBLY_ACC=CAM_ASM_000554 /TAXON_ID=420261 /ORGANISM="Thalassiosira antarctica, Strain CCMP982" /LENGTH=376 /DNA_ID=CAMNT_0048563003 /DNA_START=71 /DNA_END=1198 /DNA_ORIENTATION=+
MKPSKSNNNGGHAGGNNNNNRRSSQRKNMSRAAQTRMSTSTTHDVVDIPHFSDDQSLDSLEIMGRHLKGNLNANLREGVADNIRSGRGEGSANNRDGRNGNNGSNLNDSFNSSRSTSSAGSARGGARGGRGRGGRNGGRGEKTYTRKLSMLVEADHVDMPHMDDILQSEDILRSSVEGADAAAGNGRGLDQSYRSSSSSDRSLRGSLGSDGSGSGGNHRRGSAGRRSAAIIIEDEETSAAPSQQGLYGSSGTRRDLRETLSQESNSNPSPEVSTRSLNLDMPTLSESNRDQKSSWVFENLWGPPTNTSVAANNAQNDAPYNQEDFNGSFSGCDSSTASSSRPLKLFRTISDRVGFMRNSSSFGNDSQPPPRYYGED